MQDWKGVVGRNVRALRHERGLSQEQLAHEAELDVTYLRGIERGRRNPSLLVMARVSTALQVSPVRLLEVVQGVSEDDN